jgi:hypothetical protein
MNPALLRRGFDATQQSYGSGNLLSKPSYTSNYPHLMIVDESDETPAPRIDK